MAAYFDLQSAVIARLSIASAASSASSKLMSTWPCAVPKLRVLCFFFFLPLATADPADDDDDEAADAMLMMRDVLCPIYVKRCDVNNCEMLAAWPHDCMKQMTSCAGAVPHAH